MAEFAYEHDISRPPARTVDPEEDRISQVIELMNQLHVDRKQPPASKLSVQELDVIVFDQRDLKRYTDPCPVCYCAFALEEEGTKMPCKHTFHSDCLLPWLELHNTCPLCRYELPTNDPYYEEKRLERIGRLPKSSSGTRVVSNSWIQDLIQGRVAMPVEEESDEDEDQRNRRQASRPPTSMYS